jgi:hypothetical protein
MESTHMSLLEKALQKCICELAGLVIVYGMLKVIHDRKETDRRPQGQPECPQTQVLQPGP